jgi:hypothetical protein
LLVNDLHLLTMKWLSLPVSLKQSNPIMLVATCVYLYCNFSFEETLQLILRIFMNCIWIQVSIRWLNNIDIDKSWNSKCPNFLSGTLWIRNFFMLVIIHFSSYIPLTNNAHLSPHRYLLLRHSIEARGDRVLNFNILSLLNISF